MSPRKKKCFHEKMVALFKKFEEPKIPTRSMNSLPKNSMAWEDQKRGLLITAEKMRQVTLPVSVCRMFGSDARNRRTDTTAPSLMSIHLPPPPIPSIFHSKHNTKSVTNPLNEQQILDVLNRINTILQKISQVLNLKLCACIDRRKAANTMCLFAYFGDFPWSILGGMVDIDEINKPLPPNSVYGVWRNQFFESLQDFVPPPVFMRMKRCVDYGVDMNWCLKFVSSDHFKGALGIINAHRMNAAYSLLWTTKPQDYNPNNQEFSNARLQLIRQVKAEVYSYWTFDKISVNLRIGL